MAGPYVVTATATPNNPSEATLTTSQTVPAVGAIQISQVPTGSTTPVLYDPNDPQTWPKQGVAVSFNVPIDDPDVMTVTTDQFQYQWTVTGPNGLIQTFSSATQPTFTPSGPGTYNVQLSLTDITSGAAGLYSLSFNVEPNPIIIDSVAGTTFNSANSTFTVSLSASIPDPGPNDIYVYNWSVSPSPILGPSSSTNPTNSTFSFTGAITPEFNYLVTLTVTDENNPAISGTTSTELEIIEPGAPPLDSSNVAADATQVLALAGAGATIDASNLPASISVVETAVGGHDVLIGGQGPTYLQGDSSFNTLIAGTGDDTMVAQMGDSLVGGGASGQSNLYLVNAALGESVQANGTQNTLSFSGSKTAVNVNLGDGSGGMASNTAGDTLVTLTGSIQTVIGGQGSDTLNAGTASNVALMSGSRLATTTTLFLPGDPSTGGGIVAGAEVPGAGAVVSAETAGGAVPTGSVDFFDVTSNTDLGSSELVNGFASLQVPFPIGHVITAVYSGNVQYGSSSATRTVNPNGTALVLTSTNGSDGNTTFTAVVSNFATTPRGMVDFFDVTTQTDLTPGGVTLIKGVAVSAGANTASISGHTIVAAYTSGTNLLAGSASQTVASADLLTTSGGASITQFGGSGNDTLMSSGGSSITMIGGSGNDLLSATNVSGLLQQGGSSITQFGSSGSDMLMASGGSSVTQVGGSGNDTLLGNNVGSLMQQAGSGNQSLSVTNSSSITQFGSSGNDMLGASGGSSVTQIGGSGNDTLLAMNLSQASQQAGSGNQTLTLSGASTVTQFGGSGNDMMTASGSSSVTQIGGSGNDTLSANSVVGAMQQAGSGNQLLTQSGGSSITQFGGSGNDSLASIGGSTITMIGGSGNETLTSIPDPMTGGGGSSITMFGGSGNDSLAASGGTSVLMIGGSGSDSLSASGGLSVSMIGGSGADALTASNAVSITMFGGSGSTQLSSTQNTGAVIVGGSGSALITSTNDQSAVLIAGTSPSGATVTPSNGSSVTSFGSSGNDTIVATGGSSVTIIGGTGNDSLSAINSNNVVVVAGVGTVTVPASNGSSVTQFGGSGSDTLVSSAGSSITMIGGSGNDLLSGTNVAGLVQQGGSGNQTLSNTGGSSISQFGGSGNDTLTTSGGSSITMIGGSGNDSLAANNAINALIVGGSGNNQPDFDRRLVDYAIRRQRQRHDEGQRRQQHYHDRR